MNCEANEGIAVRTLPVMVVPAEPSLYRLPHFRGLAALTPCSNYYPLDQQYVGEYACTSPCPVRYSV